jgi:hypothetical protein
MRRRLMRRRLMRRRLMRRRLMRRVAQPPRPWATPPAREPRVKQKLRLPASRRRASPLVRPPAKPPVGQRVEWQSRSQVRKAAGRVEQSVRLRDSPMGPALPLDRLLPWPARKRVSPWVAQRLVWLMARPWGNRSGRGRRLEPGRPLERDRRLELSRRRRLRLRLRPSRLPGLGKRPRLGKRPELRRLLGLGRLPGPDRRRWTGRWWWRLRGARPRFKALPCRAPAALILLGRSRPGRALAAGPDRTPARRMGASRETAARLPPRRAVPDQPRRVPRWVSGSVRTLLWPYGLLIFRG